MVQAVMQAMENSRDQWGVTGNDRLSFAHPLLTSFCAAWFLTGGWGPLL